VEAARQLLVDGLAAQPDSEVGWLYLAKAQADPAKRREYLEKVLDLNPDNIEASAMLAMMTQGDPAAPREGLAPDDAPANVLRFERAAPRPDRPGTTGGSASQVGAGFPLPLGIPDAPERLTMDELRAAYQTAAARGVDVLLDKPGTVDFGAARWWDLLLLTVTVGLLTGLGQVIYLILVSVRALNLVSLFTLPLLVTLMTTIGAAAGCFLSHWYLTTQAGGKVSLLGHSAAIIAVWAPASVLNLVVLLFEALLRSNAITIERALLLQFGGIDAGIIITTLAGGAVVAYAAYLMHKQLGQLYIGASADRRWIAAAIMLVVTGIVA
jgi:hypothetical protein